MLFLSYNHTEDNVTDHQYDKERENVNSEIGKNNLHVFSVSRDGEMKIVASTVNAAVEGEDLARACNISRSECDFVWNSLFENISVPIVIVSARGGERKLMIILRNLIFETSVCVAMEMNISSLSLFWEADGFLLSPQTRKLMDSDMPEISLDVWRCMRDVLALTGGSFKDLFDSASSFDDLALCIKHLVGVDISVDAIDPDIVCINDSGRIFLGGFCVVSVITMAVAAKIYSADEKINISACCHSGHIVLSLSYINAKRRVWGGIELIKSIAEAYGVAFDVALSDGKTVCLMIPEKVDEALRGVKEELISSFEFF